MTLHDELIKAAVNELGFPSLGTTKQYPEIHDVERLQCIPKPERVKINEQANSAIVYFKIQGERFRLAVYLQLQPAIVVYNVATENNSRVYLRATSKSFSAHETQAMTSLQATESFNKGDNRKFGKSFYNYSGLIFEPNPEIDTFENKLNQLLSFLEHDKKGIKLLVEQAHAHIRADIDIHYANGLIGGPFLSKESIARIGKLNLGIEFDQFVTGNSFL